MTTLKQILCAILNFGHPYQIHIFEDEIGRYLNVITMKYEDVKSEELVRKECSCGKVWERKS